jgi:YbbR domain-containing protein
MRESLVALFSHNAAYKLLSVVLAALIWLYVQGDEVADAKVKARMSWSLPIGLTTTEQLPRTVQLTVRGTRAGIRRAQQARVELPVDISGLGSGDHAIDIDALGVRGLPSGLEVVATTPAAVRFVLDELTSQRVQLVSRTVGELEPGFRVESITLDPPVVDISGPRSVVTGLAQLDIVPIDVSGLAADAIFEVELDPPRSVGLAQDVRARAAVKVVPEVERRVIGGVPVAVWRHHDWRPNVQTVEVTLEGPSASLRDLGTEQVAAFVHLPDRVDAVRYDAPFGPDQGARLRVMHPGGEEVRVIDVQPSQVTVVRQ